MAALTSADAVQQALDEYDASGRDAFLAKYGYGPAKRYFVERDGKLYDSKAIYGVAVGYEHPDRGYMRNNEFSGGEGMVVPQLEGLGFTIRDTREGETGGASAEDLAEAFEAFRASEVERFRVRVRRVRAEQLRDLLSGPEALTLDVFNKEVWQIDSGSYVGGDRTEAVHPFSPKLTVGQARSLDAALDAGELELHGNCVWGSGARVFGSAMTETPEEKLELVKQAARLLVDASLIPMEKATRLVAIKGFGRNIATGLVMIFHPDDFAIYNEISQQAYTDLGFDASSLEQFERSAGELKDSLGADDYLELDWFLYPRDGVAASARVGAIDRDSIESAVRVFESELPVSARADVANLFADLIGAAEAKRAGCWTINLFPDRWQFNVGSTQVAWLWISISGSHSIAPC